VLSIEKKAILHENFVLSTKKMAILVVSRTDCFKKIESTVAKKATFEKF